MNFIKNVLALFIVLIIAPGIVLAQTEIVKQTTPADSLALKDSIAYNLLLIIPFNPKFYISDADREITTACKITFDEVKERFRNGLITKLHYRISDLNHTLPLVTYADTAKDLSRIYASITYRYEALPDPPKADKKKTVNKTVIQDGQLSTKKESALKFLNVVLLNKELLPYLSKKYGSVFFAFINQFEIQNDLSDYSAIGEGNYNRILRVHYSILNLDGRLLYGGLSTSVFPASENNVQEIINTYFKSACDDIVVHIPSLQTHILIASKEKPK